MIGILLPGLSATAAFAIAGWGAAGDVKPLPPFPHPRGYVCYRVARPPAIDGQLHDSAWRGVPWSQTFVDIEGGSKPKPRCRTRVKMVWDARNLYIAAQLEEPHVWATLTQHDSVIFRDNDFEVFIDPDGDNHQYYEIEINALNTEWDLRLVKPYRDGGPALNGWEIPGFRSAVHVRGSINNPRDKDRGWTVEMALPWKSLAPFAGRQTPPIHGDQWRINFSRVEWDLDMARTRAAGRYVKAPKRAENNWVWSPQGVVNMHWPERWGYLEFSTRPKGSDAFRQDPTWQQRDLLIRIYHAQQAFRKENLHWAAAPDEFGLPDLAAITLKGDGWEAAAATSLPNGDRIYTHIRQDSRMWTTRGRAGKGAPPSND